MTKFLIPTKGVIMRYPEFVPPQLPQHYTAATILIMDINVLINEYIQHHHNKSSSVDTIVWYESQIRPFNDWCTDNHHKSWFTADTVEIYFRHLHDTKKPPTIAARFRALRAFFNWLERRKKLHNHPSPFRYLDSPKQQQKSPKFVTFGEYTHLVSTIPSDHWIDFRDQLLVKILYLCGLRLKEVVSLNVEDVDTTQKLVRVSGGKGNKDRIVPYHDSLGYAFIQWMMNRPPGTIDALWLSNNGKNQIRGSLTKDGLRMVLKRLCKRADMRYLNAHAFRHGFAINMLNNGTELSAVSTMLGHTSTAFTAKYYARWLPAGLTDQYNKAWQNIESQ